MRLFLLVISIFQFLQLFGQTTITIPVEYDAALGYHDGYGTEFNNYSNATYNGAYCIPGAIGGLNVNRALIKFNMEAVPSCAEIIDARIDLYATGPIGLLNGHSIGNNQARLSRVIQNWNINTVNWVNQPNKTNINSVVLPPSSSSNQNYLNVNVTGLVNDMINLGNFGFIFHQEIEQTTHVMTFCSNDHPSISKRPVLRITYIDCDEDEDTTGITPIILDSNFLLIPNVFTPNSDGINDLFEIQLYQQKEVEVQIFNRWGQEVFSSRDLNPSWDGTFNGIQCSEGVYFVKYKIVFINNEMKKGYSYIHKE